MTADYEVFAVVFDSTWRQIQFLSTGQTRTRLGELDGEQIFALLRSRGVSDADLQCLYDHVREDRDPARRALH